VQRPETIRKEAKLIVDCTKIGARSLDLLKNRIGIFEAASALMALAWAIHGKDDSDLKLFQVIRREYIGLPVGQERAHWNPNSLAKVDVKIQRIDALWPDQALAAASRLAERYAWSLEARQGGELGAKV
jgi:hypothetical protein